MVTLTLCVKGETTSCSCWCICVLKQSITDYWLLIITMCMNEVGVRLLLLLWIKCLIKHWTPFLPFVRRRRWGRRWWRRWGRRWGRRWWRRWGRMWGRRWGRMWGVRMCWRIDYWYRPPPPMFVLWAFDCAACFSSSSSSCS